MREEVSSRVFISYSSADREQAESIQRIIEDAGIKCWRDKVGIYGGQRWDQVVAAQIQRSTVMVCLYSTNFLTSQYAPKEREYADKLKLTIVPIRLHDMTGAEWDGLDLLDGSTNYLNRDHEKFRHDLLVALANALGIYRLPAQAGPESVPAESAIEADRPDLALPKPRWGPLRLAELGLDRVVGARSLGREVELFGIGAAGLLTVIVDGDAQAGDTTVIVTGATDAALSSDGAVLGVVDSDQLRWCPLTSKPVTPSQRWVFSDSPCGRLLAIRGTSKVIDAIVIPPGGEQAQIDVVDAYGHSRRGTSLAGSPVSAAWTDEAVPIVIDRSGSWTSGERLGRREGDLDRSDWRAADTVRSGDATVIAALAGAPDSGDESGGKLVVRIDGAHRVFAVPPTVAAMTDIIISRPADGRDAPLLIGLSAADTLVAWSISDLAI